MNDWNERNCKIIEQFRANEGKVKGWAPLILLTTRGAKSGQHHTTPLMYIPDSDCILVIASNGAKPTNPSWYFNLLAHPKVSVEVGKETFDMHARVLTGDEREQAFVKAVARHSFYAAFQKKTTREIPVIALEKCSI